MPLFSSLPLPATRRTMAVSISQLSNFCSHVDHLNGEKVPHCHRTQRSQIYSIFLCYGQLGRRQRISVCIWAESRTPDTPVPQRAPWPAARRPASHLVEAEFHTHPTFPQTRRVWSRIDAPTCPPTRDHWIDVGAPIRFARRVEPSNGRRNYVRLPVDSTGRTSGVIAEWFGAFVPPRAAIAGIPPWRPVFASSCPIPRVKWLCTLDLEEITLFAI
jgi:hypothetical protein